jgi:amino acid permease
LALGAFTLTSGVAAVISPTGMKNGYPPGPYFFLCAVALLAFAGDVRMLLRGGVSGTKRLGRHLWRMCFALFIAAASIFLARQHLFPAVLRKTGALSLMSFLPLVLMIFWLVRVRFTNTFKETSATGAHRAYPVSV